MTMEQTQALGTRLRGSVWARFRTASLGASALALALAGAALAYEMALARCSGAR